MCVICQIGKEFIWRHKQPCPVLTKDAAAGCTHSCNTCLVAGERHYLEPCTAILAEKRGKVLHGGGSSINWQQWLLLHPSDWDTMGVNYLGKRPARLLGAAATVVDDQLHPPKTKNRGLGEDFNN